MYKTKWNKLNKLILAFMYKISHSDLRKIWHFNFIFILFILHGDKISGSCHYHMSQIIQKTDNLMNWNSINSINSINLI